MSRVWDEKRNRKKCILLTMSILLVEGEMKRGWHNPRELKFTLVDWCVGERKKLCENSVTGLIEQMEMKTHVCEHYCDDSSLDEITFILK